MRPAGLTSPNRSGATPFTVTDGWPRWSTAPTAEEERIDEMSSGVAVKRATMTGFLAAADTCGHIGHAGHVGYVHGKGFVIRVPWHGRESVGQAKGHGGRAQHLSREPNAAPAAMA